MTKKRFFSVLAVALMAIFAVGCVFMSACKKVKDTEPEHEHSYTSEVTTPATCTVDGVMTWTCVDGDYSYTEVIPATGHSYVLDTTSDKYVAADCTTSGTNVYVCSNCGDSYTENVDALGHDYTVSFDWTEEDDGSWTATTATRTACSRGDVEAGTATATVTSGVDADGNTVYTATATFGDGITATDTKTVKAGAESPEMWDELPINVDFSDAMSYEGFMSIDSESDNNGNPYIAVNENAGSGIISYIVKESKTSKLLTEDGVTALATGGATGSSKGIYFVLDLSGYDGEYVKIEVKMAANTSTADKADDGVTETPRTLYLSSNNNTPNIGGDGIIDYASSLVKSSPATLSYVGKAESNPWYLTCDKNIVIYSINISVADESDIPVVNETNVSDATELTNALGSEVDKIVLAADITGTFEISYEVTIDLAGYTISNGTNDTTHTITVADGGKLTITDSGHVGNEENVYGTVDSVVDNCAALYVEVGGEATLNGGTYTRSAENADGNTYYILVNHGTMTINSGVTVNMSATTGSSTVENGWAVPAENTNNNTAIMTINGGTFTGGSNNLIKNDDYGKLTINGGTFTNSSVSVVLNYGELEITGGTFTQNENGTNNSVVIWNIDGGVKSPTATISDGTFVGGSTATIYNDSTGEMTISDGEFKNALYAVVCSKGELTITGGTFKSTGSNLNIYVIWAYGGEISITGGTFTAGDATDYVVVASSGATIEISGGTFSGETGSTILYATETNGILISGGLFAADPSSYLANENYTVSQNSDGMYEVIAGDDGGDVGETLPSDEINFGNENDYSWIETETVTYNNKEYNAVKGSSTSSDGLLTIVGTSDNTSNTPMDINKTTSGALVTGGATQSNGAGRYVAINLGDYVGKYVSISVVFCTGSNGDARSLILSKNKETATNGETVICYGTNSDSSGSATRTNFSFTMLISEDIETLYLTWTNSIRIYSLSVTVLENATPTVIATGVSLTAESNNLVVGDETTNSTTLTLTITAADGTYSGGYAIVIKETPAEGNEGSVVGVMDNGDGTITVTAVGEGAVEISVNLVCAGSGVTCTPITITVTSGTDT